MQTELPNGFEGVSYESSGWCFVEAALSAVIKRAGRRLDLAKRTDDAMNGHYGGENIIDDYRLDIVCAAKQQPPLSPKAVERLLETQKTFTARADVTVVSALYRRFFDAVAAEATTLSFRGVDWADDELKAFLAVMPCFTTLTDLDLCHNRAVTHEGAEAVTRAILKRNASNGGCAAIRALRLDDAPPLPVLALTGRSAARGVASGLSLDLSFGKPCPLRGRSAVAIALLMQSNARLTGVDIRGNSIDKRGAEVLADAVHACTSLVTFGPIAVAELRTSSPVRLDLSNSTLMLPEVLVLAQLLPMCITLEELSLAFNGVDADGARALAEAVASGAPQLQSLDVRHNPVAHDKDSDAEDADTSKFTVS